MKLNLCSQIINRMLVVFTALFLLPVNTFSQAIIAPVQSDQIMVSGVPGVRWLNNSTHSGYGGNGTQRYVATTWQDASGCSVSIYNNSSNVIQAIPVPAGYAFVDVPDVAVGSTPVFINRAYVGVVYRATTSSGSTQIFITTYEIWVDALNMVNIISITTLPISSSINGVGVPHIDLVYNEAGPTMVADQYYIAWEDRDFSVGGVVGANACWGTLSSLTAPLPTNYVSFANPTGINGVNNGAQAVDVAGYERPGGNFAVFTYHDPNRQTIYYRILGPGNVLAPHVVFDGGAYFNFPRVDAKDPQSLGGTGSNFEIVYEVAGSASGTLEIRGYAEGGPINPITVAAFNPSITPGPNLRPTVACGIGNKYGVVFWGNAAGASNIYYQDLKWTNGSFASITPDYYQVNTTNQATTEAAIANCWNFNGTVYDPLRNYICWYDPVSQDIKFKFYAIAIPGMFRTTSENQEEVNEYIEKLVKDGAFSVAPVPAENEFYIQSNEEEINKRYVVVDAVGRNVLSGTITSIKHRVDISQLAKGVYVLNIGEKSIRVIKQ